MAKTNMTPMEIQYTKIKKEAPDSILFFRLGDFYEMFGDDAKEASEILEIALTSRNKKSENPTPMCGIPARAYEKYIAKLIRAGKSVAIADQVSDPQEKGIVERKITKIISPGTTFSDHILDAKKQNFIAAFSHITKKSQDQYALAVLEITTGESFVENFLSSNEAFREAEKLGVAELLFTPENFSHYSPSLSYFSGKLSRYFLPENSEKFITQFFGVTTLKPFGIQGNTSAIAASALLFSFIEDTQKSDIKHLSGITFRDHSDQLIIDPETIKNLELFASSNGDKKNGLFSHIDRTKTALGGRLLQQSFLAPFKSKEKIENRLNKIAELHIDDHFRETLQQELGEISDIERIIARISTGRFHARDFILLKNSLESIQTIAQTVPHEESEQWKKWITSLNKQIV